MISLGFDNTYRRLPERFYAPTDATGVRAPKVIAFNRELAGELGLDAAAIAPHAAQIFSGNTPPADAEPIALAYAGHQFGNFVPQLGDGRALLLGEVVGRNGQRHDIQLKGSGPTPFSRRRDGRAALGPVLREYIVSEAMHALGVPTTRSLAAVTTGEYVQREETMPGAVLTRVASSHIRIGTFQYFAARQDEEAIRLLADYAIERHYPALRHNPTPYLALLDAVIARQGLLVANWMRIGFIHGVMNTDNMTISGETIDYGPCAFLDEYDPGKVFSSIDRGGRYAYQNQPLIAQWNLARLAETLLFLIDSDTDKAIGKATNSINAFTGIYETHWLNFMRAKIGLATSRDTDADLINGLLTAMHQGGADFTLTFRNLCNAALDPKADAPVRTLFNRPELYDNWAVQWRHRLATEGASPTDRAIAMSAVNPLYIPRNHRIEEMIQLALSADFARFESLHTLLKHPFAEQSGMELFSAPPRTEERVGQTFCGT